MTDLPTGWEDIESAPRDGSRLILWATYVPGGKPIEVIGFRHSELGWVAETIGRPELVQLQPTHWLPLPRPPAGC